MNLLKSIVIGTAGHIDHGKTALIRALTGIDTDRLPEEKRRGITIDLGFASMQAASSEGTPLRISFVDVPGHALFIRNMLAGAGCVPAVMLVIAADEGVMPQTREHLAICELLGISEGFAVITKADLTSAAQLAEVRTRIAHFLKGTFLENSAILTVSARSGQGLDAIRGELAKLAMHARSVERHRLMRLPIDRAFVKKGFGAVVTGTLLGGEICVGQTLHLEPGSRNVRVRGLQTHGEAENVAVAGSRVAVNLSGVNANEITRGQMLVAPEGLAPTDLIDAEITLVAGAHSLKHRARVHFHVFTSEAMASVSLYSGEAIVPGRARLARLKLANPIVLVPGDRFVIRQPLPAGTIGGGRVLDAHPLPNARRAITRSWLEQIACASPQQDLLLRIRRREETGIRLHALACESGITPETLRKQIEPLLASGKLLLLAEDIVAAGEAIASAAELALTRLKSAGAAGIKQSELGSQTGLAQEILHTALERLARESKIEVRGEVIRTAGTTNPNEQRDAATLHTISDAYRLAGLAVASVRDVAQQLRLAEPEMRRLITVLLRQKILVRMGSDDVFVHAEALAQLSTKLVPLRGKTLDVAAFKALTGLTRKHAIPLLEYLDRERITRKQGELRVVL